MNTLLEHPVQAPAEQRLAWADLLRVLATFAVVVLHTSTTWLGGVAEGAPVQQILLVWDGLVRWCVPIFVMLSGAFSLDPNKALSPKSLFLGRLPRILVSLAAWGLFYNLILFGRTDGRFTWEGIQTALLLLSRGQTQYHLWFLFMILGLYLVTPVLRDVDTLGMADIEKNIKELAVKGRDGKLTVDDLTGGNFTITNGGVFGSLMSTPIINPPQSAILGMHAIKDRPMAVDGKVEILPMMYLALSYDHRLIDGRESVGFLVAIKELLEDPTRLLLDV